MVAARRHLVREQLVQRDVVERPVSLEPARLGGNAEPVSSAEARAVLSLTGCPHFVQKSAKTAAPVTTPLSQRISLNARSLGGDYRLARWWRQKRTHGSFRSTFDRGAEQLALPPSTVSCLCTRAVTVPADAHRDASTSAAGKRIPLRPEVSDAAHAPKAQTSSSPSPIFRLRPLTRSCSVRPAPCRRCRRTCVRRAHGWPSVKAPSRPRLPER